MHDVVHDFAQLMSKNECFSINSDKELGSDYKIARHLQLEILKKLNFLSLFIVQKIYAPSFLYI